MKYQVSILRCAQKELAQLPDPAYRRVRDAILSPATEPIPSDSKKLTGREGWRIRVGDYRVIYEVNSDDGTVLVLHIGHRRDVYR